jgi:hypothetical protein
MLCVYLKVMIIRVFSKCTREYFKLARLTVPEALFKDCLGPGRCLVASLTPTCKMVMATKTGSRHFHMSFSGNRVQGNRPEWVKAKT